MDRCFLGVVALVPWIPRPTIEGVGGILAPAGVALLAYLFGVWLLRERPAPRSGGPPLVRLALLCVATLVPYSLSVAMTPTVDEVVRLLARMAMLAGALSYAFWIFARSIPVAAVFRSLFYGYLGVALLIVFVGLTGVGVFEEAAPARDYGFVLPFVKTAGVPRSFGELAIIVSAAWAYCLVMRKSLPRAVGIGGSVLVPLSALISQSRTVYVAFTGVTVSYLLVRRRGTARWVPNALVAMCLAGPFLLSVALPTLEDQTVTSNLIGEEYVYNNVLDRISLADSAISMLNADPARSLLGYPRGQWDERAGNVLGEPIAPHNHFLATLLFLGAIGGGITIVFLYVSPAFALSRRRLKEPDALITYLAVVGSFISLSFYEGYFSLSFMVILACLWVSAFSRRQPQRYPGKTTRPVHAIERRGMYETKD